MITPIKSLKINEICERKDDLLMSVEDIKQIAANEKEKTIDEFANKLKFFISESMISRATEEECYLALLELLDNDIDKIANEIKK